MHEACKPCFISGLQQNNWELQLRGLPEDGAFQAATGAFQAMY
jgi:hypothetical protein